MPGCWDRRLVSQRGRARSFFQNHVWSVWIIPSFRVGLSFEPILVKRFIWIIFIFTLSHRQPKQFGEKSFWQK
jgi:hypothetical protein